jgi:membrane-associated phospholipid phosphatase
VAAADQDQVLEWMKITGDTVIAGGTSAAATGRQVALVSASVFDAVNGIKPQRYEPIHVTAKAPQHASPRAAAIQAAYAILVKLYPAQAASLTVKRNDSISAIALGRGGEHRDSIQVGVDWGQAVADSIWEWRLKDGFNPNPAPPFLGAAMEGVWRPTPRPGGLPMSGALPQNATMTPWVILRPNQFRPPAPYAPAASGYTGQPDFTSAQYHADYEETKLMGAYAGARTGDQSELALFWTGNTPLFWIRMASDVSAARHLTLSENAHLFALLNLAVADANLACWDAKYRYVLWRPITAIREGNFDPDPSWRPWLDFFPGGTPAHPEFPSGHSTLSGAGAFILASVFGDSPGMPINVTSEIRSGTRTFARYSDVLAEIHDARVFGGIHWRTACLIGSKIGASVADYVLSHAMRSRDHEGEDERR